MIHGIDLADASRAPVARLTSSGIPIKAGQTHKVWRGLVQVEGCTEPSEPVALKWMSSTIKVALELACSLAANEMKLPVPRGVVVLAPRDQLPGLPAAAKPLPGTDDMLCFGSAFHFPDDTAARLLNDDAAVEEYTWRRLCDSRHAASSAAWDELAANADRHTGNLVFDGDRYWLIDHELALEPINRLMRRFAQTVARQQLLEHRARENAIAQQLAHRRASDHGMLSQANRLARAEKQLKLLADSVRDWRTGQTAVDAVWPMTEVALRSIALRLPALAHLLSLRLGRPDAESLWSTPHPPANAR